MAPKKQVRNGFMVFTLEWKSKYGKHMDMREATSEAGKIWANMDAQERGPYNERAKREKLDMTKNVDKMSCLGTPMSLLEKEREMAEQRERQMKRTVETTVRNSLKNNELDTHSYYFIMVNYFTKTLKDGVYVPAELSVAEYSLKEGVCRKYHTFINPAVNIYGHHYEAQHHAENTHKLPLPPNAKGETNLGSIYGDVLNFVRDDSGEYPPIYTHRDSIPIVESVLNFLKCDPGASNVDLQVYSIQYLFFILKEATCELGEVEKPKSHYITDAFFERDFFEYQTGIACTYHEEIDKSKFCTQSCVTRWGFMFSDYMCKDIAISLIPGRHVPESTNLAAIIKPSPSTCGDTESQISFRTENSYATKALSEHKIYYDDQKTFVTADANSTTNSLRISSRDEYPKLGATRKKHCPNDSTYAHKSSRYSKEFERDFDDEAAHSDSLNPWSSRSRCVPREPDTSHFDIDYTRDDLSDNDAISMASYGRGRARINQSTASNASGGSGRGRFLRNLE